MIRFKPSWPIVAAFVAGVLACTAVRAFTQQAFAIADIMSDPAKFYGRTVAVSGLAGTVRYSHKTVDYKTRAQVEFVSFELYQPDAKGYHGRGRHFVSVNIPASGFGMNRPVEGRTVTVTGPLSAPLNVGRIE